MTLIDDNYRRWNAGLLEYCLAHSVDDRGRVFLTVDAFLEAQESENAEAEFTPVVRDTFLRVSRSFPRDIVRQFLPDDIRGLPLCAALLGVTVLAAGDMANNAYYEHLANWLGCSEDTVRRSFGDEIIEAAWDRLRDFFRRRDVSLPPPSSGNRYIKLPQQHALLRRVDIRRLAWFFDARALSPRYRCADEQLRLQFSAWMNQVPPPLTRCGVAAWNDDVRCGSVLKQVRDALECWDEESYWQHKRLGAPRGPGSGTGERSEEARRLDRIRSLSVRLLLYPGYEEGAKLYFDIVRPDGSLPNQIPIGDRDFRRRGGALGSDGYYAPVPIETTALANILKEGFLQREGSVQVFFRTERDAAANNLYLFQNEYGDGYTQATELRLGVPAAILVRHEFHGQVREWLQAVCGHFLKEKAIHDAVKASCWVLFCGFEPRRVVAAPHKLPALTITTDLGLRLSGGLRLDSHRTVWMQDAPPEIRFVGSPLPERGRIEAEYCNVTPEGRLTDTEALLRRPDRYQVTAVAETSHPVNRTIWIEAPTLRETRNDDALFDIFGDFYSPFVECEARSETLPPIGETPAGEDEVDTPLYRWYILGAAPGQIRACPGAMRVKALYEPGIRQGIPFLPVWAVGRGESGEAALVRLAILPPGISGNAACLSAVRSPAGRQWFDVVLRTSGNMAPMPPETITAWQSYREYARTQRREIETAAREGMR